MKIEATTPQDIAELQALALDTFGSESKAEAWLNKENLALGTTPIAMAQSESGLAEVKRVLNAVNNGGVV